MENGEDFSKDVSAEGHQNGSGDAPMADSGSADTPGRDDDRKLFVGGLSWETTDKELRDHFGQYGEIESINVKTDPNTGRSRGFAFIVFSHADAIDKVVAAGEHTINNKKVDPKKAKARHGKIFVGGLTSELTDDDIKGYFQQFGQIIEVEMPFDKTKNQRKGFCFITFESEQVVNELLKTPKQTIKDKEVDVKKATPKPDQMGPMGMMMGGRGGRGDVVVCVVVVAAVATTRTGTNLTVVAMVVMVKGMAMMAMVVAMTTMAAAVAMEEDMARTTTPTMVVMTKDMAMMEDMVVDAPTVAEKVPDIKGANREVVEVDNASRGTNLIKCAVYV
nr:unnamed protein product [Callosobruchus analis]